jgi:hypothetical protein
MREPARQFVVPLCGLARFCERRVDAYVEPVCLGGAVDHTEAGLAQASGGCHTRQGARGEVWRDQDRCSQGVYLTQDHGKLGLSDARGAGHGSRRRREAVPRTASAAVHREVPSGPAARGGSSVACWLKSVAMAAPPPGAPVPRSSVRQCMAARPPARALRNEASRNAPAPRQPPAPGRSGNSSTTRRATTTGASRPPLTWPPPTPRAPQSCTSRTWVSSRHCLCPAWIIPNGCVPCPVPPVPRQAPKAARPPVPVPM